MVSNVTKCSVFQNPVTNYLDKQDNIDNVFNMRRFVSMDNLNSQAKYPTR